ncbi:MAG: mannitol dehydrogenase [Clostridia bacterium]|nr:mannitol dehydrogenase [Clostridia bacterium]
MKAVMYGAGNIGRGFIGMLFSKSGYEVAFVDVAEPVVAAINDRREYPVRIVSNDGCEDIIVKNVRAVDGKDAPSVARAIDEADIMATAVGVNVMKFIAPVIAQGIKLRCKNGRKPLNIIICENLIDANKVMAKLIKASLTDEEKAWFDKNIGLVEASIGRMVPVQTDEMKDGDPLRVCVERYGFLPVDLEAFAGDIPRVNSMIPFKPFDFYIRRKLFIHNMGHATCAYLGIIKGVQYIYESIDDAEVRLICQSAMTESAVALSKAYGLDIAPVVNHVFDLLLRFENKALMDTCARVGGDTVRKLAANDRLIGAAGMCLENGVVPMFIAAGAAAAVRAHIETNGEVQSESSARRALKELSGLDDGDRLKEMIIKMYALIIGGASMREIRQAADRERISACGDIA